MGSFIGVTEDGRKAVQMCHSWVKWKPHSFEFELEVVIRAHVVYLQKEKYFMILSNQETVNTSEAKSEYLNI